MTLRIANGAGFLGDNLDAPRRVVEQGGVDYLTLEYLAELTMSILARSREKDPAAGYARDLIEVLPSLCPALTGSLKLITNAGGVNPLSCAKAAGKLLCEHGLGDLPVGVVTGDDLLGRIAELTATGCQFNNFDSGKPLSTLTSPIVSANAYLGARPIADALEKGAQMVITGRVADASLTVGPAMHHFKAAWDDWQFLAGTSVAGHLIECGAQVTGGLSRHWKNLDLAHVGYPIAELSGDGSCVITKAAGSGGQVSRATVVEQLVYEIGDPAHYLTPDVDVDFTTIDVAEVGPNRACVRGASGRPAPAQYKVSLAYQAGFTASGQLLVYGSDCVAKAKACGEMILERVRQAGFKMDQSLVECLGSGDGVPGLHSPPADLREVMLRVSVRDARRAAVERFTKEFAPLITSGPAGLAGYASGRASVRPMLAYWPTLVPREMVSAVVDVKSALDWSRMP